MAAAAPHPARPFKWTTCSSAATNHIFTSMQKAILHVDDMAVDPLKFLVPPPCVNGHRKPASSVGTTWQTLATQNSR